MDKFEHLYKYADWIKEAVQKTNISLANNERKNKRFDKFIIKNRLQDHRIELYILFITCKRFYYMTSFKFQTKSVSNYKGGKGNKSERISNEKKSGRENYQSYLTELKFLEGFDLDYDSIEKLTIETENDKLILKNSNLLFDIQIAISQAIKKHLNNEVQAKKAAENMPKTDQGIWIEYIVKYIKPVYLFLKDINTDFIEKNIVVDFCTAIHPDFFSKITDPIDYIGKKLQ